MAQQIENQIDLGGNFTFPGTSMTVKRLGYGAMQLAGPQVWGLPRDPDAALAVLREAVDSGVNHVDTSDFYGPHVTNQLIRQALHPYREDLVIVTKVGARRGDDKSWSHALSRQELIDAVHDNLRNLALDRLDVVNLRVGGISAPSEGSIEEPLTVLAELKQQGLIRHLGLSNISPAQMAEAQRMTDIVCVQNFYNVANRSDDAFIHELAAQGIAYVPFFPLGGFTPLQSSTLDAVASSLQAAPMQVALAWLLHRLAQHSAHPRHILRPTSSRESPGRNAAPSFRNDRQSRLNRRKSSAVRITTLAHSSSLRLGWVRPFCHPVPPASPCALLPKLELLLHGLRVVVVLVQDQIRHVSLVIREKFHVGIHNLQKELCL